MKDEEWKKIKRYPDYEISNLGRIKSYKRNKIKILSNCRDSDGYCVTGLTKDKKRDNIRIHRLVLETFNPIKNMNELQVNHINGIKDDNRYPENIKWCTQSENERHAHKLGLKNFKGNKAFSRGCGVDNPFYGKKHSEETKRLIGEKIKESLITNYKTNIANNNNG